MKSRLHVNQNLRELVAENVRYYRRKRAISQEKLAELAELDRTYISSVERGLRNISVNNIERIASALKIPPEVLVLKHKDGYPIYGELPEFNEDV